MAELELTVEQAAKAVGLKNVNTIRKYIRADELPARLPMGSRMIGYRIKEDDLMRWAAQKGLKYTRPDIPSLSA